MQKEIGQKKKVRRYTLNDRNDLLLITVNNQNKEDASELLQQKADLEKQKKESEENAVAKEKERDRKIKTIGNYVHESVPVSDNEVDFP